MRLKILFTRITQNTYKEANELVINNIIFLSISITYFNFKMIPLITRLCIINLVKAISLKQ